MVDSSPEPGVIAAHALNGLAVDLLALSRELAWQAYGEGRLEGRNYHTDPGRRLQRRIQEQLRGQAERYAKFQYFHGFPYQGLDAAHVFGDRNTELRWSSYGLDRLLGPDDRILDIGASCGFLSIHSAYRRGCRADCVEHNPHMVAIGEAVAEYLGVADRVRFFPEDFLAWTAQGTYTRIFSFAAHWTDDQGLRPDFRAHMLRLHGLLDPGGILVFESHTADVGDPAFKARMEQQRDLFRWSGSKLLDHGRRELFLMEKV
jgi:hypothetical protein